MVIKIETEALLCAAQDEALSTNAYILNCPQDPFGWLCHRFSETTFDELSACPMLAASEYLKRHNTFALLVLKALCDHFGTTTCDKLRLYISSSVILINNM